MPDAGTSAAPLPAAECGLLGGRAATGAEAGPVPSPAEIRSRTSSVSHSAPHAQDGNLSADAARLLPLLQERIAARHRAATAALEAAPPLPGAVVLSCHPFLSRPR